MRDSKGSALAVAISMVFLFGAMGLGAFNYSSMQSQYTAEQVLSTQAFWLEEAGASYGQTSLQNQITVTLQGAINAAVAANVSTSCNTYYTANPQTPGKLLADYGGFTLSNPLNAGSALIPLTFTSANFTLGKNKGTFTTTTTITPITPTVLNPNPSFANQVYTFSYNYSITSQATVGGLTGKGIQLGTGTFTVTVQQQNFAQYGLFTASQVTASGSPVWFTSSTTFNGPISTNTYFNFDGNSSSTGLAGTFNGLVTQASQTANFYNNGNYPDLLNSNQNPAAWSASTSYSSGTEVQYNSLYYSSSKNGNKGNQPDTATTFWTKIANGIDVPQFNAGFLRGQTVITLPTNGVTQAGLLSSALGTVTQPGTNGVYLPNSAGSSPVLLGGILVVGDASSIVLSEDVSNDPVYTITQGANVTTITVNYSTLTTTCSGCSDQTTGVINPATVSYSGVPNGGATQSNGTLIYITGKLTDSTSTMGLSGVVQNNTLLTIAAVGNIEIAGHVSYEPVWSSATTYAANSEVTYNTVIYNSLQNSNLNQEPDTQKTYWAAVTSANILGLISWTGNIEVSTTAPNNIVIQGALIAPNGEGLTVDSYTNTTVGSRGTIQLLGGVVGQSYGAVGTANGLGIASGYGRDFTYDSRMSNGMAPLFFPYTGQYTTNGNTGSGSNGLYTTLPWSELH